MNKFEMIKWLQNLKKDIGQSQHQDLWHYAEMLDEVTGAIEASKDCISREQVRAKLDYISYAEKDPISIAKRIVENAPSVIPQVSSEDCISRAWVQNKLTEYVKDYALNELDSWQNTIVEWIATDIEDAPSVVPSRAEGE